MKIITRSYTQDEEKKALAIRRAVKTGKPVPVYAVMRNMTGRGTWLRECGVAMPNGEWITR